MSQVYQNYRCWLNQDRMYDFLLRCDPIFKPRISSKKNLYSYARKLSNKSVQFGYYVDNDLVGFLAIYANDKINRTAFLPILAVMIEYQRMGIATNLLENAIYYLKKIDFKSLKLEVNKNNIAAINLYKKRDFILESSMDDSCFMILNLDNVEC